MLSWREVLVAVLIMAGCSGESDPRPDRGSGGSKAEPPQWLDDGAPTETHSKLIPSCYDLCAWEVKAAKDCPDNALEQCKASFLTMAAKMSGPCANTLDYLCKCYWNHGDPDQVSCTQGGVQSGSPTVPAPQECSDFVDGWAKCNP